MSLNEQEEISQPAALPEGVISYRRDGRKVYSPEFRQRVANECRDSGVSIASLGLRYGINANLIHRWMDQYGDSGGTQLLPVTLSTLPVS